MIFSDLFQSAHKSKDPQKRLSSIDKLDPSKEKDKATLHELAFNDDNDDVSLKALDKLDSFILWMKALETVQSSKIKKYAFDTCLMQLEQEAKVPDDLFVSFVLETKNKPLLETLLFSSARLRKNDELSLKVLTILGNDNQTRKYFQEFANKAQQFKLIEHQHEVKTLNRFYKLTQFEEVREVIENKLQAIEIEKQKPVKVKQQATLINSRLLALKDATDYEYLKETLAELVAEFEILKREFGCLDEISASIFSEKYLALKTTLQQKLNDLEVGYKQQLSFKQTTSLLSELNGRCNEVEDQITLLIQHSQNTEQSIEELTIDSQVKILGNSLDSIFSELDNIEQTNITVAHKKSIEELAQKVKNLQTQLVNIPKMIIAASKLSQVIQNLNNFLNGLNSENTTNENHPLEAIEQQLLSDKNALQELKREYKTLLPKSLLKEHESSTNKLQKIKNEIRQEQKQKERKVESKLKVINNMINQGKFRPAISMFHNIEELYKQLGNCSVRLQKNYENTLEEVSKLKDWQAYIAQPRKPELVEQAQKLIGTQSTDLFERAEQIKKLRQQYSSLGNLHTDEDNDLNAQFNEYIEQAFTPCREFFADLEQKREANYQQALQLIEQIENTQSDLPQTELVSLINQFKKQFSQLGEIDKKHKNRINREFNKALKPLNKAISNMVLENARLKENLLKQVENMCENLNDEAFDLHAAIVQAKEIQQKWKQIGFAGKPKDNELWQQFRASNDTLFNRYHDSLSKKQSQISEQLNEINQLCLNISKDLKNATSMSDLNFYESKRAEITDKVEVLDEKSTKSALKLIASMDDDYHQAVNTINSKKELQELQNLFSFLEDYKSPVSVDSESIEGLSSKHRSWVTTQKNSEDVLEGLDRVQLAQAAAILFDKSFDEIPIGDKASRKQIQLKIMASKLEGGESLSSEAILAAWVGLGPVTDKDKPSLEVMKTLY